MVSVLPLVTTKVNQNATSNIFLSDQQTLFITQLGLNIEHVVHVLSLFLNETKSAWSPIDAEPIHIVNTYLRAGDRRHLFQPCVAAFLDGPSVHDYVAAFGFSSEALLFLVADVEHGYEKEYDSISERTIDALVRYCGGDHQEFDDDDLWESNEDGTRSLKIIPRDN